MSKSSKILNEVNIVSSQLMRDFPLLAFWEDYKYWTGFIKIKGNLVRLSINTPKFPSSEGITMRGDGDTKSLFSTYKKEIDEALFCTKGSVYDFTKKLENILNIRAEESNNLPASTHCATFYTDLFAELELVGLDNIDFLAVNFCDVHVKHFDSTGRKHVIKFSLPPNYPNAPANATIELPIIKTEIITWPSRIRDVCTHFISIVERYIEFWEEIEEIDTNVRVIDPQQPNRSHTHRRILINEKNILQLTLNPLRPRSFPELMFSGPDMEIFDGLLDKNYNKWNDGYSVLDNLKFILECDFLPKEDGALPIGDDNEITCTICYAYNFEDEIPETECACGAVYHNKCLYELFLNDCSKKGLRRCVDCPACEMEIKVTVVNQSGW